MLLACIDPHAHTGTALHSTQHTQLAIADLVMPSSLSGTVLKKKWRLGALVGTGRCAEVYEATDIKGEGAGAGQLVAKFAPLPVGLPPAMSKGKTRKKTDQEKHADMIYYEYTLYKGFLLKHGGVVEVRLQQAHHGRLPGV